jgi:hypothetical protein
MKVKGEISLHRVGAQELLNGFIETALIDGDLFVKIKLFRSAWNVMLIMKSFVLARAIQMVTSATEE